MSISSRSLPCVPLRRLAVLTAFASLLLGAGTAAAAPAPEAPATTFAVSSSVAGELADGFGVAEYTPVGISADGRYVAFQSASQNLGEAGPVGAVEGFVKDLETGEVELVSRGDGVVGEPAEAPGISTLQLSADGRHVLFTSAATNLGTALPGEEFGQTHVYERDLETGETSLVDRVSGPAGQILSRGAEGDSISADGSVVAFTARVANLEDPVGDHTETTTAVGYVRDLDAGMTAAVGRASGAAGELANEDVAQLSLSEDGRSVSFESRASNLAAGVSEGWEQVYLHDLEAATTTLLSRNGPGEPGEASSATASLAGPQGCLVEFSSIADNLLAPAGGPGGEQAYLEDRCAAPPTIALVSRSSAGPAAAFGQASFQGPGVSADGGEAVFAGQFGLSGCCHLYLRDLEAGTTTQLDRASGEAGTSADGELELFAISANGCRAAFESRATNLVAEAAPDPGEEPTEVYVRQLAPCAENGGSGEGPGDGGNAGGGNCPGSAAAGDATCGSGGSGAPATSAAPLGVGGIAGVSSLKVGRRGIAAEVSGPATFTLRVRRLLTAPRRHWRLIRTTSFATLAAGPATIPLPKLVSGAYRLNIHLAGMPEGDSFVRRLVVPPGHPS
jgi:Tol biopolymer transport system component